MKHTTMRQIRRYHYYLGVFFAPAILLFAISGALQTFRLQEEKGWGSRPPGWIVWMASFHKDQRLPVEKPMAAKPPAPAGAQTEAPKPPVKKPFKLPLQIFVALMSIGLAVSALLGVAIALNNRATRRASITMLIAGTVLPLLMLLLL